MNNVIGWAGIAAAISGLICYAFGRSVGRAAGYWEGRRDVVREHKDNGYVRAKIACWGDERESV